MKFLLSFVGFLAVLSIFDAKSVSNVGENVIDNQEDRRQVKPLSLQHKLIQKNLQEYSIEDLEQLDHLQQSNPEKHSVLPILNPKSVSNVGENVKEKQEGRSRVKPLLLKNRLIPTNPQKHPIEDLEQSNNLQQSNPETHSVKELYKQTKKTLKLRSDDNTERWAIATCLNVGSLIAELYSLFYRSLSSDEYNYDGNEYDIPSWYDYDDHWDFDWSYPHMDNYYSSEDFWDAYYRKQDKRSGEGSFSFSSSESYDCDVN